MQKYLPMISSLERTTCAVQFRRTPKPETFPIVALTRSSRLPEAASADAVIDGVAGPLFGPLIATLRPGGRYCMFGAAAGGDVSFDAWGLIERRVLIGYSTEDLDGKALRTATRELLALRLPAPPTTVLPLAEAARAHASPRATIPTCSRWATAA